MGAAAEGAKVAVVTIDPARRLANSLGLEQLGNEPRLIDAERFTEHGVEMRGELWALMLDAKRTFDELIEHLAPDARTRDEVLSNRIYKQLSNAVAGSQVFTALAKL
jgi:anion-transporting  ArsA/GET3 family ATPase